VYPCYALLSLVGLPTGLDAVALVGSDVSRRHSGHSITSFPPACIEAGVNKLPLP
jgi:hypothetical protein